MVNLYSIPVSGATPKLVSKGGAITQIHAGPDFVVFSKSLLTAPPDLFRVSADGSSEKKLTNENASWLGQVNAPQYESLSVAGAAGAQDAYCMLQQPNFGAAHTCSTMSMISVGR